MACIQLIVDFLLQHARADPLGIGSDPILIAYDGEPDNFPAILEHGNPEVPVFPPFHLRAIPTGSFPVRLAVQCTHVENIFPCQQTDVKRRQLAMAGLIAKKFTFSGNHLYFRTGFQHGDSFGYERRANAVIAVQWQDINTLCLTDTIIPGDRHPLVLLLQKRNVIKSPRIICRDCCPTVCRPIVDKN